MSCLGFKGLSPNIYGERNVLAYPFSVIYLATGKVDNNNVGLKKVRFCNKLMEPILLGLGMVFPLMAHAFKASSPVEGC